jgi:hypothetical protein
MPPHEPATAATGTSAIAVARTHGQTPVRADTAGEVIDLIDSYLTGALSLEVLSERFRTRHWPTVPRVCPPALEQAAPAIDDPEPYIPGSFDDVVRAYDLGCLTDTDYQMLVTVAAQAYQRSNSP